MYCQRHVVNLTTDGSGDTTGYTPAITGRISSIRYAKDGGANPFADTVDFTITGDVSGIPILSVTNQTASATWAPRQATHSTAGAAALYAAAGTAVNDAICLSDERIKIVVAQGGATKVGAIHITIN